MHAKPELIREFVLKHAPWIVKMWRKLESRRASIPRPFHYASGEMHPHLGQMYPLEVQRGDKASATFLSGRIHVATKGEPTPENVRKLLDRWRRAQAQIVFHERLAACRLKMPKDIPLPPLRIRPMKTRWGSFSPQGRVTLNLWLVTMPVDCLDYVILHELCHFRIKGHGQRFWKLLERFLPDYKDRRKELNARAGYELWYARGGAHCPVGAGRRVRPVHRPDFKRAGAACAYEGCEKQFFGFRTLPTQRTEE
jgi:hypothetical protein